MERTRGVHEGCPSARSEVVPHIKEVLLEMKAEVERAKALGQHELDALVLAQLLRRYDCLLAEGYQANPPPAAPSPSEQSKPPARRAKQSPARHLLDRLSGAKWAVLRFSTLRKQGSALLSALDHTLVGHPVLPVF